MDEAPVFARTPRTSTIGRPMPPRGLRTCGGPLAAQGCENRRHYVNRAHRARLPPSVQVGGSRLHEPDSLSECLGGHVPHVSIDELYPFAPPPQAVRERAPRALLHALAGTAHDDHPPRFLLVHPDG